MGGIRWWFNEVLHIPGDPMVLLFSTVPEEHTGGDCELIEVDGYFFLKHTGDDHDEQLTFMLEGNPSLEMVLSGLRREQALTYGDPWPIDWVAVCNYDLWEEGAGGERDKLGKEFMDMY